MKAGLKLVDDQWDGDLAKYNDTNQSHQTNKGFLTHGSNLNIFLLSYKALDQHVYMA